MQEYCCMTGTEAQANSALLAKNKEKSFKSSKKSAHCGYCKYKGHSKDDCHKKKRDLEKYLRGKSGRTLTTECANIASVTAEFSTNAKQWEDEHPDLVTVTAELFADAKQWEDGTLHVFLASDVMAFLAKSVKLDAFFDSGCMQHLSPGREYFNDTTYVPLKKLWDAFFYKNGTHYLTDKQHCNTWCLECLDPVIAQSKEKEALEIANGLLLPPAKTEKGWRALGAFHKCCAASTSNAH
ncbi:hypothetical protein C8R43DRAFT_956068 [Mycena crocata]|nr:hypothetical protein C8R43DRAFT_956068 [Mycena crocata]